jgi:hypothetical protein
MTHSEPLNDNKGGEKSPLTILRQYAIDTADINPCLLDDVDAGWIKPHKGLLEFIETITNKQNERRI